MSSDSRKRMKEGGIEPIFKEMPETLSLVKNTILQDQEAERTLSIKSPKKLTSRYVIIKCLENKDEESAKRKIVHYSHRANNLNDTVLPI